MYSSLDQYRTNDTPLVPFVQTHGTVSNTLFDLASRTQDILGEKHPKSLIIGTHTSIPLVGDGLLPLLKYAEADRVRVVDTPEEVLARLRIMLLNSYRKFACVMAAFESHHFTPDQQADFMDLLEQMSHGTVIAADYAFAGIPPEQARNAATTNIEERQQRLYGGFEKWLPSHAVYTPQDFFRSTQDADWRSYEGFGMPHHKVGMIASGTLSQGELHNISKPALL